jgi:branched-chain amino acid aminotransferase
VLHYAQEIFEGLKAYRLADGAMALFRPSQNAARFNASADRLAMPEMPEEAFIEAMRQLVLADRDWFPRSRAARSTSAPSCSPASRSSACARPSSTSSSSSLSPAGNYFKSGARRCRSG